MQLWAQFVLILKSISMEDILYHYTSVSVQILKKNENRKRKYSLNRAIAWIGAYNKVKQLNIFPWNHRRRYGTLVNSVGRVIDFILWGVKIN